MFPKIAVIGQPNVGKSTLFNLLCGKKIALSGNKAGITRDRKKFEATLSGYGFFLIDTPGFDTNGTQLPKLMKKQILLAIEEADIIFFIVEAHLSPNADTIELANMLRKGNRPLLLLANKADLIEYFDETEYRKLGLGHALPISAARNIGLENIIGKLEEQKIKLIPFQKIEEDRIPVAILGKPNSGKSTLFNTLIGHERVITSDIPGTTIDTVSEVIDNKSYKIEIIDTAGLRKRNKIDGAIEHMSAGSTITAIKRAAVILLVIDAEIGFSTQDLHILSVVVNEGKSLILLINKIDLIKNKKQFRDDIKYYIEKRVNQIKNAPLLFISAIHMSKPQIILDTIQNMYLRYNKTITTGKLNKVLKTLTEKHLPPIIRGRRLKFKYMVQTATRPPTFSIFTNLKEHVPKHYDNYISNELRKAFDLDGVVIRINYVQVKNPYIRNS